MIVYIDVLLFTNIIINYCILSLTKKYLHIKTTEFKIITSSLVGSTFSLVVFIQSVPDSLSLVFKLVCVSTMCFIAFSARDIKTYIKCVSATFAFTVIFSGGILLIHNYTRTENIAVINDTVYFQIDSIKLILISLGTYILISVVQRITKNDLHNTVVSLKFTVNETEYSCIGKVDTGCSVTEPFSGAPVIIVETSLLKSDVVTNRLIPYKALGTEGILNGIKADKIFIDKREINKDIYIAIFQGVIDSQFKAIINHNIVR